jgi:hypothetical protein
MPPDTYYERVYDPTRLRDMTYRVERDAFGNEKRIPVINDDDPFMRSYARGEEKDTVKIPKPNEVKFSQQVKFAEKQELAEWEKELLGMKPVGYTTESKQEFYMGPPKRYEEGWPRPKPRPGERVAKDPSGQGCGDYECDLCYQYADNPDCEGCKRRDQQVKDLKAKIGQAESERDDAQMKHRKAQEAADKAVRERNEFDREAENLARELETAIDQRDSLMEMLMWSEEQLLKAWEEVEQLKSA